MVYSILKFISFVLSRIFFGIEIHGRQNLPVKGGYIIAGNHTSYLDPVLIGCVCPRKICYMAKEELFRNPFMAWLLRQLWVFPVKRHTADLAAMKEAMRRLRAGVGMLMFPQGSRSAALTAGAPLPGVGFLAVKSKVPVIPAFIAGTEKAMPAQARFFKFAKVRVYFGKPLDLDVEEKASYEDIAGNIMKAIALTGQISR